jgi:hypothetical protein
MRTRAFPENSISIAGAAGRMGEVRPTRRWREMDSNYWYRSTKAVGFRSIPGIARVSAGLVNDTT